MCVGALLSTILSVYQEKVAKHYGKLSSTPEGRLYFSCVESALLPIGLFWFGWSMSSSVHWIVPAIAVGCATWVYSGLCLSIGYCLTSSKTSLGCNYPEHPLER